MAISPLHILLPGGERRRQEQPPAASRGLRQELVSKKGQASLRLSRVRIAQLLLCRHGRKIILQK
jgi:hypothetical protein